MSGQRNTRGGSGDQTPRRLPTAAERRDAYWILLQDEARLAIDAGLTGTDDTLRTVITANWELLADLDREPHETDRDVVVRVIATFLERAGTSRRSEDLDAVDAIYWLTDVDWNIDDALDDLVEAEQATENPEAALKRTGKASVSETSKSSSPDPLDEVPEEYREINRLNPSADRAPAVKGQVTESKLTISLRLPGGRGLKKLRFNKYEQGAQMNWNNPAHIRELNRWRTQQLRRDLGPVREGRIYFHPEERQWLTELYQGTEQAARKKGQQPNFRSMNWDELTKDFNKHFAGQVLNKGGKPRPFRTKPSVLTERYRIPEVCRISGLKQKEPQRTGAKKEEKEEEGEEGNCNDDDDDDEEKEGGSKRHGGGKKPEKRKGNGKGNGKGKGKGKKGAKEVKEEEKDDDDDDDDDDDEEESPKSNGKGKKPEKRGGKRGGKKG